MKHYYISLNKSQRQRDIILKRFERNGYRFSILNRADFNNAAVIITTDDTRIDCYTNSVDSKADDEYLTMIINDVIRRTEAKEVFDNESKFLNNFI